MPPLELRRDAQLDQAVVAGFGETDGNGFHALEALQAIVDRRKGAETGGGFGAGVSGAEGLGAG